MVRNARMNWILLQPSEVAATGRAELAGDRAAHIQNVLRAEPGKVLRIGLVNGPFGCGTVEAVSAGTVLLSCEFEEMPPPRPPVDLLLAMPRPKVLKRLWAQLAALGVGRIILTNAEKVERFYFDTHVLAPEFYTARFIEGLQQAGDTQLPEVTIVRQLKPFLENETFPGIGKKILADPSGTRTLFQTLEKTDGDFPAVGSRVLLAIGPEGGWTPYELEMFQANGFELFGIGPRVLRTDTACIGLSCMLAEAKRIGI